jgi:hypothetical protein
MGRAVAISTFLALAAAAALPSGAGAAERACDGGYSYAGYQGSAAVYGVSARITILREPVVVSGHVAAWIGIGGPGLGPGGSDEWLEVGVAALPDGTMESYYEYVSPRQPTPKYVTVGAVDIGAALTVSIVELAVHRNAWRVSLDGKHVSPVLVLPGSHGAWGATATGEAWDGGMPACNSFSFGFAKLVTMTKLGGHWHPFALSARLESRGYRVAPRASGFTSSSD